MRVRWLSMVLLLTACPRAEKPVVIPPPPIVASAPQPRLLHRRSEPVHLDRWCESAGDALLARDKGRVVVVRDGSVKETELEGFPCRTDHELVSFHLKGASPVLSHLASDGVIYERGIPPPSGCLVRGDEVTLLRMALCPQTGEACGSIERVFLSTGASDQLVGFGRNVALHAAWVGSELIWTGLYDSAFGVWLTEGGVTKKLAESPAPQSMCCELAASKDLVLLAEQDRLLWLDRRKGTIRTVFEGYARVRSPRLDDPEHATFAYGARIASLSLKDQTITTLAALEPCRSRPPLGHTIALVSAGRRLRDALNLAFRSPISYTVIARLILRDAWRALTDAPWQTAYVAVAGGGVALLFQPAAYGAWVVVWPVTAICCAIVLFGSMAALSEPERTATFFPLGVLAGTLAGFTLAARSGLVASLVLAGLALARHVIRRRSLAPSDVLLVFAAVTTRTAIDFANPVPALILASYAWFALLLVALPDQATRGNRRLFGVAGLGVSMVATHTSLAVVTVVTSVVLLATAIEARSSAVTLSAYR